MPPPTKALFTARTNREQMDHVLDVVVEGFATNINECNDGKSDEHASDVVL